MKYNNKKYSLVVDKLIAISIFFSNEAKEKGDYYLMQKTKLLCKILSILDSNNQKELNNKFLDLLDELIDKRVVIDMCNSIFENNGIGNLFHEGNIDELKTNSFIELQFMFCYFAFYLFLDIRNRAYELGLREIEIFSSIYYEIPLKITQEINEYLILEKLFEDLKIVGFEYK